MFDLKDFCYFFESSFDRKVIILQGNGKAFCAGYDLKSYADSKDAIQATQDYPYDGMIDYKYMKGFTDDYTSLWRSYKPTICKVHGFAIAGGSDIALCCDIVVMEDKAKIGYMPARVWGVPTSGFLVHRVGVEKAKRLLFTGDKIDGIEAKAMGLVLDAVPLSELDEYVNRLANRIAGVPKNQLMMIKLMINETIDAKLQTTQKFATIFDGLARNSPEGVWFKKHSEQHGFHSAVAIRDSGSPIPGSKILKSKL